MTTYEFRKTAGHALDAPLDAEGAKAAKQLKDRLEKLGLTHDHFVVEVEGTTVSVSGDAAVQEQKEKILLALGNTYGVTSVEDLVESGQEDIPPRFVTMGEGETLSDLALRVYGDRSAVGKLQRANAPLAPAPDQTSPGWVLRAPK
ncbi:BON domain-containing protein [Streptomyces sp. NPDC046465]|uniref:BON domain-containing protein n=1 Tax=Streptomyces sp. NPDC046465 TaxID=3155810 RepID=UPI0033ED2178